MKIIRFKHLSLIPGLIHGISTKEFGNCKPNKLKNEFKVEIKPEITAFFHDIRIPLKNTVFMEQVHKEDVVSVDKDCYGKWIPGADALVTSGQNLFLCANTADCVPIFFVESEKKIIGLAHAGWKGTLGEIAGKVVERIIKAGGKKELIKVGIGPAIGPCCYNVEENRYQMFVDHFGNNQYLLKRNNQYFLDLKGLNVKILIDCGINPENIEVSLDCTSCRNDLYFSYRKDSKEKYGEMLSVIGFKL